MMDRLWPYAIFLGGIGFFFIFLGMVAEGIGRKGEAKLYSYVAHVGVYLAVIFAVFSFAFDTLNCRLFSLWYCGPIIAHNNAALVLTQVAATEQALSFTPTPTHAPFATSVRATAQAMRESALATLYPEGTPTP